MPLVKPGHNRIQQEPTQELTLEQQILGELRMLRVELLGSVDGDTTHGRLPRVETTSADHEARIKVLENDKIRWKAYAAASAAIGGFMGGAIVTVVEVVMEFLRKH